ncbi:MAG: ATP-binding protein, partial [Urechidicola sp.]|nr:ATP-binding protein [Urechidicola sp.]
KKYLEKLINPNQQFENDDFGVYIDAPEFVDENNIRNKHEKFIGLVENRIFDKLNFKSTSIETRTIENGEIIYTELKDKGNTIFWLKEKNPFYPYIKDVKISIYYLNPYAKAFFTKQTGIQSVNYGSIFLFINGFRISPYGEVGNDWLGLDQRKAQKTRSFLGLRDIIGQIELLDEENHFQIISSREGIVRNDYYKNLTNSERNNSFYYKAHRRLERYVVEGLNWDSSIYDNKDPLFKEIEQKIISGSASSEELMFREDDETKQRRTYSAIHSIISAKISDVEELYINEKLILQKIEDEREKSEREFEQLIKDFDNKKIDSETLNRILQRKAEQNADLEKQIKEFSKYTTNEATSKAILELQNYKKTIEKQTQLIDQLQKQLKVLADEKAKADKKIEEAKDEVEEVKKELTETKKQNLFLKSIKSQEFNDVLNLMHHIGISTSTIQNYIKGAVFKLENNIDFEKEELKTVFSKLNYELNKIHSISKFATKANFKVETKDSELDMVSFIEQYLMNIIKPFLPKKISLVVYEYNIENFITTFKPLELIIVLDNLINNSKKAITSRENSLETSFDPKIEINFNQLNENQLEITFQDNGIGISDENRKKIFDYGFTTTDGSGLGLTHIKELIEKIGGKIELEEKNNRIGAKFIITINKK